jgi:hypothetical protein
MTIEELSKEELINLLKEKNEKEIKQKEKIKEYISKYQKTEKGAMKSREAYKKYYYANRDKVLQKKKEDYKKKKALKSAT